RLAAASGHQHQCIFTPCQCSDDVSLGTNELVETIYVTENLVGTLQHSGALYRSQRLGTGRRMLYGIAEQVDVIPAFRKLLAGTQLRHAAGRSWGHGAVTLSMPPQRPSQALAVEG